jgi:hypothetical protein
MFGASFSEAAMRPNPPGKTRFRYTKRAGQKKGKRDEDGPKEEKVRLYAINLYNSHHI